MPDLQGLGSVAAAIAGWLHNRVGSWLVPWLLTAGYGAAVLFTPFLPEAAPPPPGVCRPKALPQQTFPSGRRQHRADPGCPRCLLRPCGAILALPGPEKPRATPLTATAAWMRCKVTQQVVVDRHLLQLLGRVIPLTLLTRPTVSAPMPASVHPKRLIRDHASIEAVAG
jgi:hypothetical protein